MRIKKPKNKAIRLSIYNLRSDPEASLSASLIVTTRSIGLEDSRGSKGGVGGKEEKERY